MSIKLTKEQIESLEKALEYNANALHNEGYDDTEEEIFNNIVSGLYE